MDPSYGHGRLYNDQATAGIPIVVFGLKRRIIGQGMCKSLAKICYYLIILTSHNSKHTLQQLQSTASKFYVRFGEALFSQHRVIFFYKYFKY